MRKGTLHGCPGFSDTKHKLDMHFQLALLTLIGQNQELCQRVILLNPVGILQESTSPVINS